MKNLLKVIMALVLLGFTTSPLMASDGVDGAKLFSKKCKMCHAIDKNKTGPSLRSMSQDDSVLRDVITNGSAKKKMMKSYGKKFSSEKIDALISYIRSVQ